MDLSPEIHAELDARFPQSVSTLEVSTHADTILHIVVMDSECIKRYADVWPIDPKTSCIEVLTSRPEIRGILCAAHAERRYAPIRMLRKYHLMSIEFSLTPH